MRCLAMIPSRCDCGGCWMRSPRVVGIVAAIAVASGILSGAQAVPITIIDVPGSNYTEVHGINDTGQVVGWYYGNTGPKSTAAGL
jgi:hypothetical protein